MKRIFKMNEDLGLGVSTYISSTKDIKVIPVTNHYGNGSWKVVNPVDELKEEIKDLKEKYDFLLKVIRKIKFLDGK